MLFSSFKNLVSFFRQSDRGLTKSNTSNQFCKPVIGLCALLCMSLWISAAQAQQMRTNLASADLIPASYTYADPNGAEVTVGTPGSTLDSATYDDPNNTADDVGLVDWVEVQIRVVADAAEAPTDRPTDVANLYIKPAWLLSDGSVVDAELAAVTACRSNPATDCTLTIPTGTEGLTFDAATQNLYVVITHRNHLPIMSAFAVTEASGVYNYDFTTGTDQAVGGVSALKETGGVLGMIVADTGRDGNVGGSDISADIRPNIGASTYHVGDVTLDANVGGADVAQAQANTGAAAQITY